ARPVRSFPVKIKHVISSERSKTMYSRSGSTLLSVAAISVFFLFSLLAISTPGTAAPVPEGRQVEETLLKEEPSGVVQDLPEEDPANKDRDSALSPGERARKPAKGGVITIGMENDPSTLNNITRNDGYSQRICLFIYPRLMQLDPDTLELFPFTAAAPPESSDDKKCYTWRLRKGLKWDDFDESGAYVTTRDVKFSFDLMMNPDTRCPAVNDLVHLLDIRIIDEYTFQALYDEPCVDAVYKLGTELRLAPAHLLDEVLPAEIASHPIGRSPVGYGPFRFHHWKSQDEILLVRNDMNRDIFPESARPFIDGMRYQRIPDRSMMLKKFLREEIDLCMLSEDDWHINTETLEFKKIATRHRYYIPWWSYIAWNNTSPLFSDARVRRAMTHMVRREEVLGTHRYGLGATLSGPFFIHSKAYDHSIEPLPFDPEIAIRLLKEAGWEDHDHDGILDKMINGKTQRFEFDFLINTNHADYLEALLLALQQDLRKVGILMQIRPLEWSAFYQRIENRSFEAMSSGYMTTPVFEDPYRKWHSSLADTVSNNKPGYRNPEVDRLLEQVRLEFDETKRYNILRAVHRIIHEDQPCTFLYSLSSLVAINKRWRNVKIHKTGCDLYEWWLPPENRRPSDEIPR
ncbi:MAG: ABC transporter substrate-binding protein, partial [Planctomycetota bacterium]